MGRNPGSLSHIWPSLLQKLPIRPASVFFLLRGSHDPVCGCANQQKKLVCVYIHAQLLTKGPFLVFQSSFLLWVRELDCIEPETLVGAGKLAWPLLSGSSKRKLGAG